MTQELASILQKATDAAYVQEAGAQLKSMQESDLQNYLTLLKQIMVGPEFSMQSRYLSLIMAWQTFPTDIPDISSDQKTPFDILPIEFITDLMDTSYQMMSSNDQCIANFSASLFGRIASLHVHYDPDDGVLTRLTQALESSSTPLQITPVSIAFQEILSSLSPEEEEIQSLMEVIFKHLETTQSVEVSNCVLSILLNIIENLSDILEDSNACSLVATSLLTLLQVKELQKVVFDCWTSIGRFYPSILCDVSPSLIQIILKSTQSNDSPEAIISACALIKKFAKLEISDVSERMNTVENNLQQIVLTLLKIVCSATDPEPDSVEAWAPHIAAMQSLEVVVRIDPDEVLLNCSDIIFQMMHSSEFTDRAASTFLLSCIIPYSEDSNSRFLDMLLSLATDFSARVRANAVRCLSLLSDKGDSSFANNLYQLSSMLDDNPSVSSEVCSLLASISKIEGFQFTSQTLNELFSRALDKQSFYAFSAINQIIDKGSDAESIIQFFPRVASILESSIKGESSLVCEACETISAFSIRFGERVECQAVIENLVIAARTESFALTTIGLIATTNKASFIPYLNEVLKMMIDAMRNKEYPEAMYNGSLGLSLLLTSGCDLCSQANDILSELLSITSEVSIWPKIRRAALQGVADIGEVYPNVFASEFSKVLTQLTLFIEGLPVQRVEDKEEGQAMMEAISNTILNGMIAAGEEESNSSLSLALQLVDDASSFEITDNDCMKSILNLIEYLSEHYNNRVLILIDDNEEVGDLIVVTAASFAELKEKRKRILDLLHYEGEIEN